MKTKKGAIVFITILSIFFVLSPLFVIYKTVKFQGGYKGLNWGVSEDQTIQWLKKNSNKAIWTKCDNNHYGSLCYKVTWKEKDSQEFEYIEFQFQNEKLCAVIESYKPTDVNPLRTYNLGSAQNGTDLEIFYKKEKGVKYKYIDRAFYYNSSPIRKNTENRYVISQLIKSIPADESFPDTVEQYQFTKGYFSTEFVSFESESINFPTYRFKHK